MEPTLYIVHVTRVHDETSSGLAITADRAVITYSLGTGPELTATFRWGRADDQLESDLPHGSWVWDELHDAAWSALHATKHELARVNYVRACEREDRRRPPVANLDADLDGGPTRRIPPETLAEVAASYYAARAVMA